MFDKEFILENDKVLLRPLKMSDKSNLLEFSLNEPDTWQYSLVPANGEENLIQYIKIALQAREHKTAYPFIVFDKRTKEYCGSTRFYDMDFKNQCLSIGYTWYGKRFRGTGLNKNCKFLLLDFAFKELNIERVEFRADSNNKRSIQAMKNIGCLEEGILRSNMNTPQGTRRNSIVLSILKSEWSATIKNRLYQNL